MAAREYIEHYSVEDRKEWDGEWELIYGYPYAMAPSPMVTHQSVNIKIARQLDEKLDNCKKCQALFEIDWEISSDTVVRPDTIVICYEPDEKITKRPDLIFEIASPSTARRDETLKHELYGLEGVPYYVIVFPTKKLAKLYKVKDGKYIKSGEFSDETYTFELNGCNIEFDFSTIWRR